MLEREVLELEIMAKQCLFLTVNAAVNKRICNDLDIAEEELYKYSSLQMLIYCAIGCYIRTGKPFGALNLTARGYKIFNSCESQIKYDLLSNIIFLIGRLPHPQKINQYGGIHRSSAEFFSPPLEVIGPAHAL